MMAMANEIEYDHKQNLMIQRCHPGEKENIKDLTIRNCILGLPKSISQHEISTLVTCGEKMTHRIIDNIYFLA
jgi:hypothetical protein